MSPETCQNLTEKQSALLLALLKSPTISSAAEKAKVSERSAYRWLADPAFKEQYRSSRRQVLEQACVLVTSGVGAAVATLLKVCTSEASPASARVAAAKAILDVSFRALEHDDLGARLEALEKAIAAPEGGLPGETARLNGMARA